MVFVVMLGGVVALQEPLLMSAAASRAVALAAASAASCATSRSIPLIVLLLVLVVVLELLRPGIVNERWVANTIKFAIPLAILAACQTLTMLTGGIDLSVGIVATMCAFVMATLVTTQDPAVAILIALVPAALVGLANGIGIAVFRVHPLIMTLGMGLIVHGLPAGLSAHRICRPVRNSRRVWPGSAPDARTASPTRLSCSCRWPLRSSLACAAPASVACSTRSATTRGAARFAGVLIWQVISCST